MRIVIDMQGAQTESRFGKIGRYSLSLAKAMVRNRGEHEIFLALNGLFPDTIEPIRAAFNDLLPQEHIRVWYAPGPIRECQSGNEWRREVAERIREAFLASLRPDVVYISSLFEGYLDDAVTSIGAFAPQLTTVITLYNVDFLPGLDDRDPKTVPVYEQYRLRKNETIKRAQRCLRLTDLRIQSDAENGVPVLEHVKMVSSGQAGLGKCSEVTVDSLNENEVNGAELQMNATWTENAQKAIAIFEGLLTPAHENRQVDYSVDTLIQRIGDIKGVRGDEQALLEIASAIAANHPENRRRRLYVDISDLVQKDLQTGIQRVTRSIVNALLNDPPEGYQVEPVYATVVSRGYLHARRYAHQFGVQPGKSQVDEPLDPQPGDIFLGLDFVAGIVTAQQSYLIWMRNHGVRVYFVVYDLLPIKLPHAFLPVYEIGHRQWLEVIADFDGAICISRAVQSDLDTWVKEYGPKRLRPFKTDWFHLGADLENSIPTRGIPANAKEVFDQLAVRTSFLMVGTIEPRKGQTQTLAAFELLWSSGEDINLVIVGKEGWMVEELVKKLRKHPERNQRLFWLEGISDEYLEKVYSASTCLIAASEGEGFGLALIEAAQHNLPIIARDIPVFREVAGIHAFYFDGMSPDILSQAIKNWLKLHAVDNHRLSDNMPWLTWKESAQQLISVSGGLI